MDLKSLLDRPNRLPTIPQVTHRLIETFGAENASSEEVVRQLSTDPALSAKLLRLANSAYFNLSRTIATVDDALRMLGFVMVRNLVLGHGISAAFRNTPGIEMPRFWRHSLYTACAARWLAARAGRDADLAFTVGLLHGIGQLHMHCAIPESMAPLDLQADVLAAGRAEVESRALGFHHGEVAAGLAAHWNFPPAIVLALRAVAHPLGAERFSEPAACAHLGAWRARIDVLGIAADESAASYPGEVAARLGLDADWAPVHATPDRRDRSATMPPLAQLSEGMEAMFS